MNSAPPRAPFLRIDRLRKVFGDFTALNEVSLAIDEGEFICFLGPSGCGKTTLLRAVAGLDIQTAGRVWQAGRDISELPPAERDFGIVFQSYALFPNLTVARNIAFGLENQKLKRADIERRVTELLALVNLSGQEGKYPAQLSGGEQQRVALTRALATSPGLLLLDEPLSALDARVRAHLRVEMKALQRRLGVTTIMVTHDQEEALTMADRIVVMNHGVIEQVGTPTEIYRRPDTLFVAEFVGAMNRIAGAGAGAGRVTVGEVTLDTQAHAAAAGAPVVAAIRPEDVLPHAGAAGGGESGGSDSAGDAAGGDATDGDAAGGDAASAAGNNRLQARVDYLEFLGSFWRVSLTCAALGGVALTADLSSNAMRRMRIEAGARVDLELPAERVLVFPRGRGA
ncbi:MAG: putative 2-aminoethylphosphonate ABC transporter ATP-binding protein [Gammaproteobacteria bacterium]|nr:putative 2-aminoethylphosphonate ABC transporter ATP-binding protein [Gammaproteobacteria bacterium]